MSILWLVILFFILLCLNIPISFTMLIISSIYVFSNNVPITIIAHALTSSSDSFIISAVPLFILAANFMQRGTITDRIINFANAFVGHLRGGLALVNVLASMLFSGMSGSVLADAGGLGPIEIEMMKKGGYDLPFSAAITAASATIGPIIPPSIVMVVYGSIARESVGKLFMGGAIPGLLIGISLMIQCYFISKKRNYPLRKWAGFRELYKASVEMFLPILTPLIIIGGIAGGIFTPTEAAGIASLYAFILSKFVYRKMSWNDFFHALLDTALLSAVVLFIMATAGLWSWMVTSSGISKNILNLLMSISKNPSVVLLILNLITIAMGLVMEPLAIMIMVLPITIPILNTYGISILHYGVVMSVALMFGTITPPFGEVLFILSSITKLSVMRIAKACFPFYLSIIFVLFLITYIPSLVLWLPKILMK